MTEEYRLLDFKSIIEQETGHGGAGGPNQVVFAFPEASGTPGSVTTTYHMRGVDSACGSLTYHYWRVEDGPDSTGAEAGTLPCGGPLTDIVVLKVVISS